MLQHITACRRWVSHYIISGDIISCDISYHIIYLIILQHVRDRYYILSHDIISDHITAYHNEIILEHGLHY